MQPGSLDHRGGLASAARRRRTARSRSSTRAGGASARVHGCRRARGRRASPSRSSRTASRCGWVATSAGNALAPRSCG
jgi:hypothetical protein